MKDARLVASKIGADADVVKKLPRNEFDRVVVSSAPDKAVDDFGCNQSDVLILGFNTLEKRNPDTWVPTA